MDENDCNDVILDDNVILKGCNFRLIEKVKRLKVMVKLFVVYES